MINSTFNNLKPSKMSNSTKVNTSCVLSSPLTSSPKGLTLFKTNSGLSSKRSRWSGINLLMVAVIAAICSFAIVTPSFSQTYFTESFEGAWYLNGNNLNAAIDAGPNAPSGWNQTRLTNNIVPAGCAGGAHDWGQSTRTGTTWSSSGSYPTGCVPYGGSPGSVPAGSKALWFYDGNTNGSSTRRIESPAIDLSASISPVMSFSYSYAGGAVVTLVGSLDGGTTWNTLNTISSTASAAWVTKIVAIPASYKIAGAKFGYQIVSSYGSYDVFIDDVKLREGIAPSAAPILFTTSSVTNVGMTIGWTDNSTNETAFNVYRSTDNITFSFIGSVASTTSAGSGTTYSQVQTGLTSLVTYYYKIAAVVEGESDYLTGNLATNPPSLYTVTANGGLWSSAATWVGGVVPPALNDITIPAGSIVTVDQITSYRDLTINGTLQWNASTNAMTLAGNLTINSGGKFLPYTTGQIGQTVNIAGNLENNGYANLAIASTFINFNGLGSTLSGTGTFQGDGIRGIIRGLSFANLGSNSINTSQDLTLTSTLALTAGSLNTNGKIKIDNTAQIYGQALNLQVANLAVTGMGSGYTVAPVVFGTAVIQYAFPLSAVLGNRYVSGNNVYLCTTAGAFNATAPTSTNLQATFTTSGPTLLYIGTVGTLGTNLPYNNTLSLTTQYFHGNNVYQALATTSITNAANMPIHTSGVVNNLRYLGTVAKATVNFDVATGTVRSLNLTQAGSGFSTAPAVAFSVGNSGGLGSGAAATAVLIQQVAGSTSFLSQVSGVATISGGLTINSDQGASVASSDVQASSGVGAISTSNGGLNYTVAPLVGFAGPATLNLVTNPGSGYTAAPTITVVAAANTLVSGTALTSANFTITVNQGKVISVYLNTGTTATYSVPPTLTITGNATIAFPAGCWPAATANLGSNGQIISFNMNNSGFGYAAAPTVGVGTVTATATGGTFTTVATAPTARIALYGLTLNWFSPAVSAVVCQENAFIPSNRKLNNLTLAGNGNGLILANNLTLFGTSPFTFTASLSTPGNILDLGGYNLNFTWNGYAGSAYPYYNAASGNAYIKNGSMTLTGRGGGTTGSTFSYPFDVPFQVTTGTGVGFIDGTNILRTTVSRVSVANTTSGGTGVAQGTRSYKVENKTTLGAAGVSGTNPKVTMSYQNIDGLTAVQNNTFVVQSPSNSGPWTVVSAPYSATLSTNMPTVAGTYGSYGTLASSVVASPAPITLGETNYFSWGKAAAVITNVAGPSTVSPLEVCAYIDMITITGSGLTGVTAVSIGGTPVSSFTIVSSTQITCYSAAGTSGVVSLTKDGDITTGMQTITINNGPAAPVLSSTAVSAMFGAQITLAVSSPVAGTFYNWYSTPYLGFSPVTDSVYTASACGNLYVSAGTGACESQRTPVVVTIQYPQIVASDDVFCGVGGALSLQAAPFAPTASIVWESLTPGVSLSSTTANPTSTSIVNTSDFKLTVSAPGCADYTLFKSIGVYPLPSATVTTSASGVCPGTAATINSGLSAGNFSVTSVPFVSQVPPANAGVIMNNGTAVLPLSGGTMDDGGWSGIPIGFNFNYFGSNFSNLSVGTNGLLMFGTPAGYGTGPGQLGQFSFVGPTYFPNASNPGNVIALMAADGHAGTSTTGSIKYWTSGYAPNRVFNLKYSNYNFYSANPQFTASVKLYETTGYVEIYIDSKSYSNSAIVGLQNASKTIGAVAPGRPTNPTTGLSSAWTVTTGEAWRFAPPSDFSTIWTANGAQIANGTNIFTQSVSPTSTTLYDISYANLTTGCASEPGSAQVNMVVLSNAPITGVLTTSSDSIVCPLSTVSLAHNYTGSTDGLSYQWQSSLDGGLTWLDVVGATNTTFSPIQNVATSYRVGIRACLGEITYSSPRAIAMKDYMLCYCTPNTGGIYDEEITNVTLSSLNNSSTCTTIAPGLGSVAAVYGNYSTLPATNLFQAQPVSGSLTIGSCGSYNYSSGAAIFIDYNHNGSFTDVGERVWSNGSAYNISCVPASTVSASFTPPLTSLTGLTRMRIANVEYTAGDNILPCYSPSYGEIEDYMVNIIAPLTPPASPIATNFGVCSLGDTISMVGTPPVGVAYYWQTSATGTSLSNSASTWLVNGNGTYYIRAYRSEFNQWSSASSITINTFPIITPPTAITNLSGSPYCNSSTLQVGPSPAGAAYYWQGTNPLGTVNTNPTTSNFTASASGTYYVAALDSVTGCWSMTTSINVVVYPAPTGSVLATIASSCASLEGTVAFNVFGAGTVFASNFSSSTLPAGVSLAGNDAAITNNGRLRLTSAANAKNGGLLIQNLSGASSNSYQVDFDFQTTSGGSSTPADGLSYSYGPDVVALPTGLGSTVVGTTVAPGTTQPENGSGSALKLAFDAYTNGANAEGVYLMYNCPIWNQTTSSSGVISYSDNVAWRSTATAGATTHVTIKVNSAGQLSMWLNGALSVSNQQLPASYLAADKSTWKHAFSARTGGLNQGHFIDNVDIHYNMYEYSLTDTTWSTSSPVAALPGTYNASVRYAGVGGCVVPLGQVTVGEFSMSQVSISATDLLACPEEVMTINGSVSGMSNNLSYQWQSSVNNGSTWVNIAGATNSTSVSATQTSSSLYRLGVFYCADTIASYTSPVSISMDSVAVPTIAVSSPESTVCPGTSVTFTANIANEGALTPACNYTFNKLANWSLGWYGAKMRVMNGATVVATLDLTTGYSQAQTVALQSGISYTLEWNTPSNSSGYYDYMVGINIVDPSGNTIYNMPFSGFGNPDLSETTLTTISPNCSSSQILMANSTIAWQVNGVAVAGANALTYTTSSLSPGDTVTASVKILSPCLSSTVVSSPANLVITPALIPTVVASSDNSSVCQGAPVTFTASGNPSNLAAPTFCNYTFNILDSYGDGWNGAIMKVLRDTTVVATLTLASGYSTVQSVLLESGISYSLKWTTAGSYAGEVGINIVNPSGTTIYSMPYLSSTLSGTTLTTFAANCAPPSPYQWRLNGSPIAGATGTTYTSSALSSTDVVTVSYSTNALCYSQTPVVSNAVSVNVVANTAITTPVTATYSYTWPDNGQTYTASGIYSGSITNCVTQKLNLTILQPTVTFQVDMAQSNAPAGAIPYVNGTYNNWCGACNPMTNIGGSVWSLTIPLPANSNHEYKFTFNGWDGAENLLAGSSCTVTNWGNTNRPLAIGTTDMVLPLVCWNSCSACGPQSLVKFQVDMGLSGAPAGVTPAVNGSFNGWCGACNTMTNVGGTIWETTILLPNGPYEYKFTYNGWDGQESLVEGSSCTVTNWGYTNRTLSLTAGSITLPYASVVLPMVCWNSCSACVYPPSIALQLFLDGYYINTSNPPSMRAARYTNLLESGSQAPGAATDVDVITVELRSPSNLEVAAYSVSPILQRNGSALCVFPLGALVGSYYVVVNHRASNPLWSANPITLTSSSTLSFASNASNAYNDGDPSITPMHTIASGLYGVWLGELNGDDYLDNQDYSVYEADTYSSGYLGLYMLDGDLNGDAYVDATDYAVYDFNSNQGTYTQRPY